MPEAEPWQIGIQFFQVGKSKSAQEQLRELDDNVPDMISQYCNGTRIDMEDTVPFTGAENAKLTGDRILISVDGVLVKYKNASKKYCLRSQCMRPAEDLFSSQLSVYDVRGLENLVQTMCLVDPPFASIES